MPHGEGFQSSLVRRIAAFLGEIGIRVKPADLPGATFLPGVTIFEGAILADESRLAHPGDPLQEAGHLAVMLPAERAAAIAWSCAAVRHL